MSEQNQPQDDVRPDEELRDEDLESVAGGKSIRVTDPVIMPIDPIVTLPYEPLPEIETI